MKIELELTPEIETLSLSWVLPDGCGENTMRKGLKQLKEAIEKTKNRIQPEDLVRYNKENRVEYFICKSDHRYHWGNQKTKTDKSGVYLGDCFPKEYCRKATPEEEKLIRPLLEK